MQQPNVPTMKKFLFLAAATALQACNIDDFVNTDNGGNFHKDEKNCSCASYVEPKKAEVAMRVTINPENPQPKITIYDGPMDRNIVVKTIVADKERNLDSLKVNVKYTYVTEYIKGCDTIVVPVHAELSVNNTTCNGYNCFDVANNIIDLRLKY